MADIKKDYTLREIAKSASYLGITGYGGPAILAQMKKELVHKNRPQKTTQFLYHWFSIFFFVIIFIKMNKYHS